MLTHIPHTGENLYSVHKNKHRGETMSVPSILKVFINLGVHMMVHTGEKAYESSHGDKAFTVKGNIDIKRMTHTGEKP